MSRRVEVQIGTIEMVAVIAIIGGIIVLATGLVRLPPQWGGQQQWSGSGSYGAYGSASPYGSGAPRLPVPSQSATWPSYNPGGATWAPGTGGYAPRPYISQPSYGGW